MQRRVSVLLGAGVFAALGGLWLAVPEERIAAVAATELQRLVGRDFGFADADARLWPAPGLVFSDVVVDGPHGALARADRVVLTVGAGALFGGEVAITGVEMTGLHVVAGRDSNGRNLWTLAQGTEGGAAASVLHLRQVVVRDGSVDWADSRSGFALLATGMDARLANGAIQAEAVVNGQPVRLQAEADDAVALWSGGSAARGQMEAGGVQLLFDGSAGLAPLFAEGQVTLDAADLAALAALAGGPVPAFPAGLGRDLRQLKGHVTLTPQGSWHLRDGTMALDGNRLAVAADLAFNGPRPRLAAQVESAELDIVLDGWRPDLPLRGLLTAADAELGLRLGMVALDGRQMGPLRAEVRVDRSRAEVALREVGLFGGRMAGDVVVNARDGLSVSGNLAVAGLDLASAGSMLGWGDRLAGRADARFAFRGSGDGDDATALLAGLDGEGRLGLGQGVLHGADLATLFRTADAHGADGTTDIDLATASFVMREGKLTTDDLRIESAEVALAGQATVGLASGTIDLRLQPLRLSMDPDLAGSTPPALVPMRVAGTWANPGVAFDLGVLAERELAAERERAVVPPARLQPVDVIPLSGTR